MFAGYVKRPGNSRDIGIDFNPVTNWYDLYDIVSHDLISSCYDTLDNAMLAASQWFYNDISDTWFCD